jgi:hypothetical protein
MRLTFSILAALSSLTFCACGTRNIKPGETPNSHEGIAFVRVILSGAPSSMIHLFTKGDRMGPHKARVDATEGDHVYAVIMAQGEYDIGQISAEGRTSIWPGSSLCPFFKVIEGNPNYIGTLTLIYEPSKWYRLSQKYQIRCSNSPSDVADALKMYESTYGYQDPLTANMPLEPIR